MLSLQHEVRHANSNPEESLELPTRELLEGMWHFTAQAIMVVLTRR